MVACSGGGEQPGGAPPGPPPSQTGGPPPPGPGSPTPNQGGPTPDTTPPTIVSTTPATSAENVDQTIRIIVNFSEAIRPETINAESFLISHTEGAIRGQIIVAPDSLSAQFIPERLLRASSRHTVVIRTTVADLADNRLAQDYSLTFTTMADTTPPRVVATTPATGAVDGEPINPVVVQFSEEMDPNTISQETINITRRYFGLLPGDTGFLPERELPVEGTVQLNANGMSVTFTPSRRLALLTRYTISVASTAQDLAGNNLEAYTAQFTTRDGIWQAPELIEQDGSGDGFDPRVGIDNVGNATIVWQQRIESTDNILANRYRIDPQGNRWETVVQLENDSGDTGDFDLAVAPNGRAIAVFTQQEATARNLRANVLNDGIWQATPDTIETLGETAGLPQIRYSEFGDDHFVIWPHNEAGTTNLYANRYFQGADGSLGWEGGRSLESGVTSVGNPSLSPNLIGQIFAFWLQDQDVYFNVHLREGVRADDVVGWQEGRMFMDDTILDAEEAEEMLRLDSPRTFGPPVGSLLSFSEGFLGMMLFPITNTRVGNTRILSMFFTSGDPRLNLLGRIQLPNGTLDIASGFIRGLQLLTDDQGHMFAFWQQGSGARADAFVQRFDPRAVRDGRAGWWDPLATQLGAPGVTDGIPRLGIDNNGNALVVWPQENNIVARRFRTDTGWTSPGQTLSTLDTLPRRTHRIDIAVNDDGYAVAVWGRQAEGRLSIHAARFE